MSDEDQPGDLPEPTSPRRYTDRPDRSHEPIRDGYRLDEEAQPAVLYGVDGKPRCSARARTAPGGICHMQRMKRQKRCHMHGGKSPQAKERLARERVDEKLTAMAAYYDKGPIQDPLSALKELAGEVVGWKDFMREKVAELDTLSYSTDYGETARAVVQLFERAMDRAGDFLFKIAKLNIDERLAAVSEQQAKMIEDGFFDALDEAGIPVTAMDTRDKVAVAFARHLSVVPA